jgi:NitT/TauT family transport system ATP-binding protein
MTGRARILELPVAIEIRNAARRFLTSSGTEYHALQAIDLDIMAGTFVSIVGPSGCGKSTLLNMIAGLTEPSDGSIKIFGRPLTGINTEAAYMFQQDALLPWKTVVANIALGLELRGIDKVQAEGSALEWVDRVGLKGFAHSYPHQLSGGMRKRAAMAQVFITDRRLLLMDEPFSALDVHTRYRMEDEALQLWSGSQRTVVFVTHDLEEAIALSDEVIILSAGPAARIIGRYPIDLTRPRNLIDMKTDDRFHRIYNSIWSTLRSEVLKSHE